MQITIANRENSVYKVSGRMSLLQELREQGVDLPYGCQYGGFITCAAKLIKGEDEPIYLPASETCKFNQIIFAHGYYASALHEISHWCLAGSESVVGLMLVRHKPLFGWPRL